MKANLEDNGSLNNFKEVSQKDLDESLNNVNVKDVYLKDKTLEDLKKLIGKEVEILVS